MALKKYLSNWPYLAALFGAAVLFSFAFLATRSRTSAGAEVVQARPLRAVYTVPASAIPGGFAQPVRSAEGQAAEGQSRVQIPVDFYDFGSISAKAVVKRDFLIINRGSAPLVILQAYTTCGCTSAELTASVIPPGKASRVTITFNAGFHPVAGQTVRRGLVLETNDPSRPEAEIWVQASVGK